MTNKWFVVINPTSGNGSAGKKWPQIKQLLIERSFDFDYKISQYHKHAIHLTTEAILYGYKKIIAVGGDGTFHQVVNGIYNSEKITNLDIKLGIIPVGTGNDWVKTYNIPANYHEAVSIIENDFTTVQDIGKLTVEESNEKIYFNNLAGIGFDAFVAQKIHHYKYLGYLAYLIAGILSIMNFKRPKLSIQIDNKTIVTNKKSLMFLIGLCNYCGGGMQLTENVKLSDGLFDITYVEHFGFFNILFNLHNIFNGRLCNHKLVKTFKSNDSKPEKDTL